jgi:hypothetical protein
VARVLLDAAPPAPVVDERDDDADADAVGDLEDLVERAECLLVELARPLHVARDRVRPILLADRDHVDANGAPAELPDARERVGDLVLVREAPLVGGLEGHVVLDEVEVRNIERDETVLARPFHELVARAGDEVAHVVLRGDRGRQREHGEDGDQELRGEATPWSAASLRTSGVARPRHASPPAG